MKPVGNHTDAELVNLLNNGDRRAFAIIYNTYARELFRYAQRNIPVKEDCEEIIQDVFESIWVRRKSLQVTTLRFYLFRMVRYKVIRYFQHNSVMKRYAEHYLLFESVYDNLDLDALDHEVIQTLMDNRIAELPERCQVALRLRLDESLSNGDIATRMNITKKTVEGYMFQAFAHMRSSFPKPAQKSYIPSPIPG